MITTIEMQTLIIGIMISKSLQEVLQSDLYQTRESLSNSPNFVTKFPVAQWIQILKF